MNKIEGMGRTRVGRFAAVTIPAALLSAGLGVSMLQGMVGAVLSSSQGFTMQTDQISTNNLKTRVGAADVAGGAEATVYNETGTTTTASKLNIVTPGVNIPVFGAKAHLELTSTDTSISLGKVILNAKTLQTNGATLGNTKMGIAQSTAGFKDTDAGYVADAFALTSDNAVLPGVNATAYAITLDGLTLSNLGLAVKLG